MRSCSGLRAGSLAFCQSAGESGEVGFLLPERSRGLGVHVLTRRRPYGSRESRTDARPGYQAARATHVFARKSLHACQGAAALTDVHLAFDVRQRIQVRIGIASRKGVGWGASALRQRFAVQRALSSRVMSAARTAEAVHVSQNKP